MRRKRKSWFGRNFNIWDLVLLSAIIVSGWYIYHLFGLQGLYENVAVGIFSALFVGIIVNIIYKKSKR